ncbi:hypothetical protein ACFYWF_31600 [Streptomyces sp. NPDC003344]|uniref:hypothetical protein n=1 Tax=Streptomyces sp. NPDC003344 TaxID=3364682 RepID=UPI0036881719
MRQTTNAELTKAWQTVPEVAKAQERHEAARKLLREFPRQSTPAEALAAVQDDAIATLRHTGKWPNDFAKRAATAHADALVWEAEVVALRRAEAELQYEAESTRDDMAPDVLAHLGRRLAEILTAAKDASTALGGVTTAEGAIDAGGDALDAWRRLTGLVADLRNVRAAAWNVLRSVSGTDERALLNKWAAQGHGEVRGVRLDDVPAHVRAAVRDQSYSIEHLVWLAHSDAAYVPTSFADLEADVMAAEEPVSYDDHGPMRAYDMNPRITPIPVPAPPNTSRDPRPFLD